MKAKHWSHIHVYHQTTLRALRRRSADGSAFTLRDPGRDLSRAEHESQRCSGARNVGDYRQHPFPDDAEQALSKQLFVERRHA